MKQFQIIKVKKKKPHINTLACRWRQMLYLNLIQFHNHCFTTKQVTVYCYILKVYRFKRYIFKLLYITFAITSSLEISITEQYPSTPTPPPPPNPSCSCYYKLKYKKKNISKRNVTQYGKLQNVQNYISDSRLSVNRL